MRLSGRVWTALLDVPVTVTANVPGAAVALAVRVSVVPLLEGFGVNAAVTPSGRPEAVNVTVPLKPFEGVIVIALVSWPPCPTLKVLGLAVSVKPAGQLFTRL